MISALLMLVVMQGADPFAPSPDPIPVGIEMKTSFEKGVYDAKAAYPVFKSKSTVAQIANEAFRKHISKAMMEFIAEAKKVRKDWPGEGQFDFVAETFVSVSRRDLISGYTKIYSYTGGAHGMTLLTPMSFGIVSGKAARLKLQDLFQAGVDALGTVSPLVMDELRKNAGAAWVAEGEVTSLDKAQGEKFLITPTALAYLFDPYEMGPYSSGPITAKLPLSRLAGKLKEDGPLAPILNP